MKNKHTTSSIIALMAGMALATPLMAAETTPASGSQLEEVIVTAQKRAENVQATAIAITAVSGANLAKDRVLSLEDLGHNLTGISFTANSPQANEINIRGVVNTRLTSPTADQSVSTFVDGVYVNRSGNLNSSFYDIERIEVVRGPQGVLLGKNVAGGAINIISNAPSFNQSGRMTVALGNYDLKQTNGYITGPLTETLAGRLSFQTINRGGYAMDLLHNVEVENLDSVQARGQVAYRPTDSDLRASLSVDYSKSADDGVNRVGVKSSTLPAGPNIWSGTRKLISAARGAPLSIREGFPVWPQFAGDIAPSPQSATRENFSAIGKIDKDVAKNVRLSSITGFRANEAYTLYDQTALGPVNGYNLSAANLAAVGSSLLFAEPVNFRETVSLFTQEVRLASTDEASRLDWIVGAFYLKSRVTQKNRFWGESLVLPTLSGESHWIDHGSNEDMAVFGRIGYKLTDSLKVEVGARYTKDKKGGDQQGIIVATGDRFNPLDKAPLTPLVEAFKVNYGEEWSEVTPQATLRWTPNETQMAYLTASKGFKGGGFQNNASKAFPAATPYQPETVTNYEFGYKTELFDRTVRWNTAVFYMDYLNLQVQQTLASCLCNVISNAASANIKGVETDLQWAPNSWFKAWASGSYVDAKYDAFVFAGVNNSGKRMQRTPKLQGAVGVEATTSLGSWKDALSGRLSYRYQDRMPWAPENTAWEDGYGTLDGRVTVTSPEKGWTVSAFAKNMTDEAYRTNIIVFFNDEMSSYGAPRTYGLELSVPF